MRFNAEQYFAEAIAEAMLSTEIVSASSTLCHLTIPFCSPLQYGPPM
ncbi:MAG: hypothetical protein QXI91_01225 [Candidatus Bathyarchaeia archaeon]